MKDKLRILIADISDDLKSIDTIKYQFDVFISSIGNKVPDNFQKPVLGYQMHNFYNACENIFLNIAKTFENNIDPIEWHKSILKRMKLDIVEIRPAVISDDLYAVLDEFRSFRHVFRYIYSHELDWERQRIIVDKFDKAVLLLKKEIGLFIDVLKDMCAQVN